MIHPSAGGKKHWLLIVDDSTDYTHSFILKKQNDLVEIMIVWIKNLFMKYHIRIKIGQLWRKQNASSTKFGNII